MKRKMISIGIKFLLVICIVSPLIASASTLQWGPAAEDVTGYRIYYGIVQGSYTDNKDMGMATEYSISDLPLTENTTYYFVVTANNAAGESENSNEMSWTVPDRTPPLVPASLTYNEQNATLQWMANTESDLLEYRVYKGTVSRNYSPFISAGEETSYSITGLAEGQTYYFAVTAVDESSNESGYSNEVTYTFFAPPVVDTTKPLISITSPTSGAVYQTNSNSMEISGTASDNIGITQVSWNNSRGGSGQAAGTTSWVISTVSLLEGENVITIAASDAAGNEGSKVLTVNYIPPDTVSPTVMISSPTTGSNFTTSQASIALSGMASDNIDVTLVTWNNSRGGEVMRPAPIIGIFQTLHWLKVKILSLFKLLTEPAMEAIKFWQ